MDEKVYLCVGIDPVNQKVIALSFSRQKKIDLSTIPEAEYVSVYHWFEVSDMVGTEIATWLRVNNVPKEEVSQVIESLCRKLLGII